VHIFNRTPRSLFLSERPFKYENCNVVGHVGRVPVRVRNFLGGRHSYFCVRRRRQIRASKVDNEVLKTGNAALSRLSVSASEIDRWKFSSRGFSFDRFDYELHRRHVYQTAFYYSYVLWKTKFSELWFAIIQTDLPDHRNQQLLMWGAIFTR